MSTAVRRLLALLGPIVALTALLVGCDETQQLANGCLARTTVVEIAGEQTTYYDGARLPDSATVDVVDARWGTQVPFTSYPFRLREDGGADLCVVGGHISVNLADTAPWTTWKTTAGFLVKNPGVQVVGTTLGNVGDGFRLAGQGDSSDWSLRGVRIERAHDDCIENDAMHSGLVDDSLFDGCYDFYSARDNSGDADGSANRVTIRDSLVRLQRMPKSAIGGPGHGPLWKMADLASQGVSPALVIHNTIFRVDEVPVKGDLDMPAQNGVPYLDPDDEAACSNNTIIWGGTGPVPADLLRYEADYPHCFRVLSGQAGLDLWTAERDAWFARHR
jgi:hypothetical protein